MRIDMVAASWESDTAEERTHVTGLAAALSGHGHDVRLYTRLDSRDSPERRRTKWGYELVRVPAGPATPLPKADVLAHLDGIGAFLDREWADRAPDVVHLHSWMSGLAVRDSAAPLAQSFCVLKAVEDRFRPSTAPAARWRGDVERLVAMAADRVIAASSDEMGGLARVGGARPRVALGPGGGGPGRVRPRGPVATRRPRGRGP